MDFRGQKVSERAIQVVLAVFAVAAFLFGYGLQSFQLMMVIFSSGLGITFLATVPNWPVYNRHPVAWLPPKQQQEQQGPARGPATGGARPPPRKRAAPLSSLWNLFR